MSRSLALGIAVITTTVIAACTLYQSPDRDSFNSNPTVKTSSLDSGAETEPTATATPASKLLNLATNAEFCRSWISEEDAAAALSFDQVLVESEPDAAHTCRITFADETRFHLLCTVAPDARLLVAEGLDLSRLPSALRVSGGTRESQGPPRLTVARRLTGGQAIVCKTLFASSADLNENLALLGVRTEALTELLASRFRTR